MKPNWALIGILAGFVATVTIVLMIVLSPPTFVGPELPTTETALEGETTTATLTVHEDGCFFVGLAGIEYYAIWPSGFVRDESAVVSGPLTIADGDEFVVTGAIVDRASAVDDNEYLNRVTGSCMGQDSNDDVLVMTSVGGA